MDVIVSSNRNASLNASPDWGHLTTPAANSALVSAGIKGARERTVNAMNGDRIEINASD